MRIGSFIISRDSIIIISAITLKLALNQVILFNSGYLSDEFLHIEAGNHLAFGYLDFPPMIGFLSFLQNLLHSDSIIVNRLFANFASVLIIVFFSKTVLILGGKRLALVLGLSCILFSPAFGLSQSLFLPVVFEQLFWVLCIYFLAIYSKSPRDKYLIYIALVAALGFLTKYSILLLFAGIAFSVLLLKREILGKKAFWIGLLIFLALIAPNIWWQFDNQFPVFRHITELYDSQLNSPHFLSEIKTLLVFNNPVSIFMLIAALFVIPFSNQFRPYRLLSFSLLISFIFLFIAKGKSYYYLPIILGLIALSAVYYETLLQNKNWIIYTYLSILMIMGIYLLPNAMPLLKLERYISFYRKDKNEVENIPLQFDNFYYEELWNPIMKSVKECYESLPEEEKQKCLVWGRHYSHSGAINLFSKKHNLPQAFSFHSSFYTWIPEFSRDAIIIAIADKGWTKQHYLKYFDEVQELHAINNPYALNESWSVHTIFLCRKLKYNSSELRQIFKNEIY